MIKINAYAYYAFLTAATLLFAKLQLARTNAQGPSCGRMRPNTGSESEGGSGGAHGGGACGMTVSLVLQRVQWHPQMGLMGAQRTLGAVAWRRAQRCQCSSRCKSCNPKTVV